MCTNDILIERAQSRDFYTMFGHHYFGLFYPGRVATNVGTWIVG